MAAKKELFAKQEPQGTPCAANPSCRYFGRLWIRTLQPNERICVDHYYIALNQDPSLKHDPVVPPRMAGVTAKPVAGA